MVSFPCVNDLQSFESAKHEWGPEVNSIMPLKSMHTCYVFILYMCFDLYITFSKVSLYSINSSTIVFFIQSHLIPSLGDQACFSSDIIKYQNIQNITSVFNITLNLFPF